MNRKRAAVVAGVALAGLAGAGTVALVSERSSGGQPAAEEAPAATAPVVSTDVARRQTLSGTLGRSGTYTVIAPGHGTLTWLPANGAVIGRGKPAYEVDGKPVILLFGERPPWRALQSGMTDGADVQQLEDNLRALGYGAGVTVDQHFSSATYWAIRRWQKDSGLPVTGTVPLGQVVFVAGAVRVSAADARAGSAVGPGDTVEHGTGEQRAITVQVTTYVLASVHVGDSVVVSLPDGTIKPGTVTTVGAVAQQQNGSAGAGQGSQGGGSNTQPTAPVVITLTGEVSNVIEDAQVQVGFTVDAHPGVLAVPIPALRALPGAQYEVLVADGAQTRHVTVRVGIFDQIANLVEVSGDGLAAGQRVAVPPDTA
ncbi:peptidoglycan-binding domain-containing protein [Dactylosporangium darangshiense]|uniref:Peptidoglycan-binding protein n=1 Tax=Dactylosporangium darangshiense TaxID=579108 RepID=A0ABP8DDQ8_9ACTN